MNFEKIKFRTMLHIPQYSHKSIIFWLLFISSYIFILYYFEYDMIYVSLIAIWIALLLFKKTSEIIMTVSIRVATPLMIGFLSIIIYQKMHDTQFIRYFQSNLVSTQKLSTFFLQIIATLYAICNAFLLWKGLTDFDNLKSALKDEANEIHSISEFFRYFDNGDKNDKNSNIINDIRENLIEYIDNITVSHRIKTHSSNMKILRQIIKCVSELDCKDDNDRVALSEIMRCINDLTLIRSRRMACIENRMSPFLIVILIMMSIAILIPFALEDPRSYTLAPTFMFCLSVFFSFLILTLFDLDHPFDGYWKIQTGAFQEISEILQADIEHGETSSKADLMHRSNAISSDEDSSDRKQVHTGAQTATAAVTGS